MSRNLISAFLLTTLVVTGCSHVESHDLRPTHPPVVFGEFVTQTTHTLDFEGMDISVSTPGRRPIYDSRRITDNVVLSNNRNAVNLAIINSSEASPLAPQFVSVTFYDGPTGHEIETLSYTSAVLPPGESAQAELTTEMEAPSGTYYWSYHLQPAEGGEAALQAYEEANASVDDDEDGGDDWGDDSDW